MNRKRRIDRIKRTTESKDYREPVWIEIYEEDLKENLVECEIILCGQNKSIGVLDLKERTITFKEPLKCILGSSLAEIHKISNLSEKTLYRFEICLKHLNLL